MIDMLEKTAEAMQYWIVFFFFFVCFFSQRQVILVHIIYVIGCEQLTIVLYMYLYVRVLGIDANKFER